MSNEILSEFIDKRITVIGYFEKHSAVTLLDGSIMPTALFQDCFAIIEKEEHDIGHRWVQHAGELKKYDLVNGTKIKMSVRVKQYRKKKDYSDVAADRMAYEVKYSLQYPTELEILSSPATVSATPKTPLIPPGLVTVEEPKSHTVMLGKKYCPHCNAVIGARNHNCPLCRKPTPPKSVAKYAERPTKIDWPESNELAAMVEEKPFVQVAKDLGVSDNAIRKRLANHPPEPEPVEVAPAPEPPHPVVMPMRGADKLAKLNNLIETCGGIEQTETALSLIESFGGVAPVRQFIELLGGV